MGLFSKKEACPVCGGEVKGLFLVKIAGKQTLCKNCSRNVSMPKDAMKAASPEYMQEHLEYRKKNAERFSYMHWDCKYDKVPGLKVGVDWTERVFYMIHDDLHDDENPVLFSFDQIKSYELYRLNKRVDGDEMPGETEIFTMTTALGGIARALSNKDASHVDYFKLNFTTTEPYWPEVKLKITFDPDWLFDYTLNFSEDIIAICQILKRAARRES